MQSSPPNISHPLPPLAAKSPILLVACRCRGDALSLENAKVMIYEASFVGSPNFSCCLLRLSIVEFYLLHHILVPKSNTVFSTSTTSLRYHLAVPLSCIFWVTKKAHNYLLILHIQGRHCDQLWLCPYRRCCLIISHDSFWCLLANNNLLCKFFDKLFDQLRKLFDKFKSLTNPSKIYIFYVIHASSSLTSWRWKIQINDKPK